MSTFSNAWTNMDPAIRDFYRNFANHYCNITNKWSDDQAPPYGRFEWALHFWIYHNGYHIAQHNWTYQLFETGTFDKNRAVIIKPEYLDFSLEYEPVWDIMQVEPYGNQHVDIPALASNYPRPARRAPKHYWTGAPRPRQNLT